METFLTSFLLLLIAEMGDKTQLVALAFTARFKAYQVILGVAAATALTNFIAVVAGGLISSAVNVEIIKIVSFILFILFGLWTAFGKEEENADTQKKVIISPFFTVALFFFISEFGDKTQIAAMTIAANGSPAAVFAGAVLGMFCANLVGICAGIFLGKKLPVNVIKYIAAALFIAVGVSGLIFILVKGK
ncbi:TMEM165/GDT1 family protein [Endomicrobium proavitum]|uniref:GDT1 family protein n=1 Tax=Endomicrobium proavitum TaxID=1408281 RepID=A0A0G3WJ00_9BACT|nr:TMEM165/GDT1 family protein [Endomicrobium proavitum]AKL98636.1 conserved membrane protein of unknown function [Endomicrobium proavitum]